MPSVSVFRQDGIYVYLWNGTKKPSLKTILGTKSGGGADELDLMLLGLGVGARSFYEPTDEDRSSEIIGGGEFDESFFDEVKAPVTEKIDINKSIWTQKSVKYITIDREIFDEETIEDFRWEIETVTGIPVPEQHLSTVDNGLPYQFILNDSTMEINMLDLASRAQVWHHAAPIDMELSKYPDDEIRVIDNESFTRLTEAEHWRLIPLDQIIPREQLTAVETNILYSGCIRQFYPMMTREMLRQWTLSTLQRDFPGFAVPYDDTADNLRKDFLSRLNSKEVEQIRSKMTASVKETDLWISRKPVRWNYRGLFDQLHTGNGVVSVRAVCEGPDNIRYQADRINEFGRESRLNPRWHEYMEIIIRPDPSIERVFTLMVTPAGVYIRTRWNEDSKLDFSDVVKLTKAAVTPVLRQLPELPRFVHPQFSNTSLAFWFGNISREQFNSLGQILAAQAQAGLILLKESINEHSAQYDYYMRYGMISHSQALIHRLGWQNWYGRYYVPSMMSRWSKMFRLKRPCRWHLQGNTLKITINSMRNDDESAIAGSIIALGISDAMKTKGKSSKSDDGTNQRARQLRNKDPNLYNLNQYDADAPIYTKVCQKKHQPKIISADEARKMSKSRVIRYWNFTEDRPELYSCPNAFPHMRFITGKHPRNFCLPCCKKMSVEKSSNEQRKQINSECFRHHVYVPDDDSTGANLNYVIHYLKPLPNGRLSRLHPLLEPVLYRTGAEGTDSSCTALGKRLYHYGIPQLVAVEGPKNTKYSVQSGRICCISHAMHKTPLELLDELVHVMKANGAEAAEEYSTVKLVQRAFNGTKIPDRGIITEPVEQTVLDMVERYLNVGTVVFTDDETSLRLHMPRYLQNVEAMFPRIGRRWCALLRRANETWTVIYNMNPHLYRSKGYIGDPIGESLFDVGSDFIKTISDVVAGSLNNRNFGSLTVASVRKFAKENRYYNAVVLYRDDPTTAAGIGLEDEYGETIFVPTPATHFDPAEELAQQDEIDYARLETVLNFIERYNHWVGHDVIKPKAYITSVKQIKGKHVKVVWGFIAGGRHWYIRPIRLDAAMKEFPLRQERRYVLPLTTIGNLMQRGGFDSETTKGPTKDRFTLLRKQALERRYGYDVLRARYIDYAATIKNQQLRNRLSKIIKQRNRKALNVFIDKLPEQDRTFFTDNQSKILRGEKNILAIIEETQWAFDTEEIRKIENVDDLIKRLQRMPLTERVQQPNIHAVPTGLLKNERLNKQSSALHCDDISGRSCVNSLRDIELSVSKSTLDGYYRILAWEILNRPKMTSDTVLDWFRFKQRKNEKVTVKQL